MMAYEAGVPVFPTAAVAVVETRHLGVSRSMAVVIAEPDPLGQSVDLMRRFARGPGECAWTAYGHLLALTVAFGKKARTVRFLFQRDADRPALICLARTGALVVAPSCCLEHPELIEQLGAVLTIPTADLARELALEGLARA